MTSLPAAPGWLRSTGQQVSLFQALQVAIPVAGPCLSSLPGPLVLRSMRACHRHLAPHLVVLMPEAQGQTGEVSCSDGHGCRDSSHSVPDFDPSSIPNLRCSSFPRPRTLKGERSLLRGGGPSLSQVPHAVLADRASASGPFPPASVPDLGD